MLRALNDISPSVVHAAHMYIVERRQRIRFNEWGITGLGGVGWSGVGCIPANCSGHRRDVGMSNCVIGRGAGCIYQAVFDQLVLQTRG